MAVAVTATTEQSNSSSVQNHPIIVKNERYRSHGNFAIAS
ncbi:hypothetical protein LSPCS325_13020 [Lysinibacillus sp. CTST325]